MEIIKFWIAANITYHGLTFNTPLLMEYRHTGLRYVRKSRSKVENYTSSFDIAKRYLSEGKKVIVKSGYYYIDRMAIKIPLDDGTIVDWYINNEGDHYIVNKVSKYAQRRHKELSIETTLTTL